MSHWIPMSRSKSRVASQFIILYFLLNLFYGNFMGDLLCTGLGKVSMYFNMTCITCYTYNNVNIVYALNSIGCTQMSHATLNTFQRSHNFTPKMEHGLMRAKKTHDPSVMVVTFCTHRNHNVCMKTPLWVHLIPTKWKSHPTNETFLFTVVTWPNNSNCFSNLVEISVHDIEPLIHSKTSPPNLRRILHPATTQKTQMPIQRCQPRH